MKRIGQGNTAEVFESGVGEVLKLYRVGFPMNAVQEEFEMSKSAYELGIRTPRPLSVTEIDGRAGVLYEKIQGTTLLDQIRNRPAKLNRFAARLAELHIQMHQSGVPDFRRKQKEVLHHHIMQAPLLSQLEKSRIIDYLHTLPSGDRLCHGDYHPDNVLVDSQHEWIIDWTTATSGHPAADVARTVILLRYGTLPKGTPWFARIVISLVRKLMLKSYFDHYLLNAQLEESDIEQWVLPVAAARLNEWIPEKEKLMLVDFIKNRLESIVELNP